MDRWGTMERRLFSTGEEGGGDEPASPEEEKYLSQLASSVLGKKPFPYKQRVRGAERDPVTPSPSSETVRKPSGEVPAPAPPSARQTPTPRPMATPRPVAGSRPGTGGTFAAGTILLFDDASIGIYKDERPDKEYEVVLMLLPDGAVVSQGVSLIHYEVRSIGLLPPDFLLRLQRRKTWDRDEIVFHLTTYDYCRHIPQPATGDIGEQRASGESSLSGVVRKLPSNQEEPKRMTTGRQFTINFGQQEWSAVYWGEDDLGTVIVHCTNESWALMHMDLRRFKDSLVLGDLVPAATLQKIRADIGH